MSIEVMLRMWTRTVVSTWSDEGHLYSIAQSVSGAVVGPAKNSKRQLRTIAEKRQIVEETMVEGASVARIARAHGVNAIKFSTGACSIEKEECLLDGSRMRREVHVRFCERLAVRFRGPTLQICVLSDHRLRCAVATFLDDLASGTPEAIK
jgi:hypothetical protein